ncbi:MAG: thioredoxin family protein [Phycisphaeraceae bacterium]|nr:thioredoxin family protein [Phycisphaeraceae bacterium]
MARTPSTMLPLGTRAPAFTLPNAGEDGSPVSLNDFAAKPLLLVMFICNHCPFVKHLRTGLAAFARDYSHKGLAIVAINSNDAERYPDDAPAAMRTEAANFGYTFPYLFDESQAVAKAYHAACTPDFFLFDSSRSLVYRGQFDESRPGNDIPVTGRDLRAAVDALLAGNPAPTEQRPSIGCNIKWKVGNEPVYAR